MIAVIFEVQIATSKQGQYLSLASQLRPLLNNIDGFISIHLIPLMCKNHLHIDYFYIRYSFQQDHITMHLPHYQ